jgi:hypothetical protein
LVVTARVTVDEAQAAVSATGGDTERAFVCRTRDISHTGLLLETVEILRPGTRLQLNLLDPELGDTIEVRGTVTRLTMPTSSGAVNVGVQLDSPGADWLALVARAQTRSGEAITAERPARRLRVLVVSDDIARRGAVALYVTSGWDVRFATDLTGTEEALRGIHIDAVIAEHDLNDRRWADVLEAAQRAQPHAKRIVRSSLHGQPSPPPGKPGDLVHRVVDLHAGLEAVLDALTADWGLT